MKDSLDNLLKKLKSLGLKDFVLSQEDNIIIKAGNEFKLSINDKISLTKDFEVRIEETQNGILIVY